MGPLDPHGPATLSPLRGRGRDERTAPLPRGGGMGRGRGHSLAADGDDGRRVVVVVRLAVLALVRPEHADLHYVLPGLRVGRDGPDGAERLRLAGPERLVVELLVDDRVAA